MPWRQTLELELGQATSTNNPIEMCNDGGPVPNAAAIAVALRYLSSSEDGHEGHILLGILRRSPIAFDGQPLCDYFERFPRNRWMAAEIMDASKAVVPCDWIARSLIDDSYGRDREMLCHAIVKHCSPMKARAALRAVFGQLPAHACFGLGKVGTLEDLELMLEAASRYSDWRRRAIMRKGVEPLAKKLDVSIPVDALPTVKRKRR